MEASRRRLDDERHTNRPKLPEPAAKACRTIGLPSSAADTFTEMLGNVPSAVSTPYHGQRCPPPPQPSSMPVGANLSAAGSGSVRAQGVGNGSTRPITYLEAEVVAVQPLTSLEHIAGSALRLKAQVSVVASDARPFNKLNKEIPPKEMQESNKEMPQAATLSQATPLQVSSQSLTGGNVMFVTEGNMLHLTSQTAHRSYG